MMKSRLLLPGNRLLGSLIYAEDSQKRPYLKFSVKSKIGGSSIWHENKKEKSRTTIDEVEESSLSLDISYKFADSLLELKREIPGQKPFRRFLKVDIPIKAFLFMLRVKNWGKLPVVEPDNNSLMIAAPQDTGEIIIFFSFLGENGLPYIGEEFFDENKKAVSADLPQPFPFNKICIIAVQDTKNEEEYDITFAVPHEDPLKQ